jgi:hypothetical protein
MSEPRRKRSRRAAVTSTPASRVYAWLERLFRFGEFASGQAETPKTRQQPTRPPSPARRTPDLN